MNFKLWKIGCAVAFFCALADALGVYVAAEAVIWGKVIAFAVIKGLGGAALYMKQHPPEAIQFDSNNKPTDQTMKNISLFLIIGVAALMLATGCTTQKKTTYQRDAIGASIVETSSGVVLFPVDYVSVTNGAGQVMTYAKYEAVVTTNKSPFSLAGFIAGYGNSRTAFRDVATESHTGSGKALLADSKYTQLTSDFSSGSRFSGSSSLSVGSIDLTINTNAITATGNAGNQMIQGIGSAVGQFVNKGVTGKP